MTYHRPATLDEALRLLADGQARVLAGGTDLYPGRGARLDFPVVDITAVADLTTITRDKDGLRLGAAVRWSALAEASLPEAAACLQQAARQVGGRQVQNAGTIGGNLCNASPAADGVPALLALQAEVELAGPQGTRRLPLAAFLKGPRRTALAPAEMLVAVHVPAPALHGRSAFQKLGARAYLVISIAMVAARLVTLDGRVAQAAIAVGACSGVAQRLPAVEAALVGAPLSDLRSRVRAADLALSLAPIDDVRATAAYRLQAATELVARTVERCT